LSDFRTPDVVFLTEEINFSDGLNFFNNQGVVEVYFTPVPIAIVHWRCMGDSKHNQNLKTLFYKTANPTPKPGENRALFRV